MQNKLNVNFMTQREFLLSNGLELRHKILVQSAKKDQDKISLATDRLIDKNKMGDIFKVMVNYR